MKDVWLPSGLEKIGVQCFASSGIEELILPESVREVGAEAFQYCNCLETVQLNEGLERLGEKETINEREFEGGVFVNSAIENIRLPSTLRRIEAEMFEGCEHLRSVEIPDGIECIGKESFRGCALKSVTFPASVKEICEEAFSENQLKKIMFSSGSKLKTVGDCAFSGNDLLDRENVCFPNDARVSKNTFGYG